MQREPLVRTAHWLLCLAVVVLTRNAVHACPYCSLMGSTITLDVENSDIVLVGSAQNDGTFRVERFLKGDELLHENPEGLQLESVPKNVPLLVFGDKLDGDLFEWRETRAISRPVYRYLVGALDALAQEPIDIAYFYPMLGHERSAIADDAFYQFARADFSILDGAKEYFDIERLIQLIDSPNTMPELRELAFKLLGMVGTESNAQLPLAEIKSADAGSRRNLKTVMACYLALAGERGLDWLRAEYLGNIDSKYEFTHAAIEAVRFHLKQTDRFDDSRLLNALQAVLKNPEISDLVLPDLMEAEDWTAASQVAELFRTAPQEKRWIRVASARYLLAAPESETKDIVGELRAIDESAFAEAETGKAAPPEKAKQESGAAARSLVDLATRFLDSPMIAAALIACVIATLAMICLRLFSKKS